MEIVGFSTIYNTYIKMKPKVSQVGKVSQGSRNPDSAWAKARSNFIKQLAIRFGKLDPTKVSNPAFPNNNVSVMSEPGKFYLSIFYWGVEPG